MERWNFPLFLFTGGPARPEAGIAGTALDPNDNLTIWHIEEYAKGAGSQSEWGTWISALQITSSTPDFSLGATRPHRRRSSWSLAVVRTFP